MNRKLPLRKVVAGVGYTLQTRPNFVRKTVNGKNATRLCGRIVVYVKDTFNPQTM